MLFTHLSLPFSQNRMKIPPRKTFNKIKTKFMKSVLKRESGTLPMFYIKVNRETAWQANFFGRGLCLT
jgi:hypothetical protein